MSVGCECVGGSDVVSSAYDILEMSVVRGCRVVGGVCEMCMARIGVGGVGARIGFGLYQSCRNRSV